MISRKRRNSITGLLLLTPSLLTLLLVVVLPIIYVAYLSFHGSYYGSPTGFVGLKNYVRIPHRPELLRLAEEHSRLYRVGTVAGQFLLGLAFALIINQP